MRLFCVLLATLLLVLILWMNYIFNHGGGNALLTFIGSIPYGDKITHFFVYGGLTFVGIIATNFKRLLAGRFSIYIVVLLVSIFVLAEEVSQLFITTRTFDWGDLIADLIGITVAIVLANIIEQKDA